MTAGQYKLIQNKQNYMDPSSLENLLQAAAVDQLIGYEGNQTAHNLLQEVQGTQTKYPAYPVSYTHLTLPTNREV